MKHRIEIIVSLAMFISILATPTACNNDVTQILKSTNIIDFGGVNSTSSKSANGLSLYLSLDSATYHLYQYVTIVIDEKNTLLKTNNVPVVNKWKTNELSLNSCTSGPFGVAVFKGYRTSSDFSAATPLVIFNPSSRSCPLEPSPASYSFQPSSDIADLIVDSDPDSTIKDQEISAEIPVEGYWNANSINSFNSFDPGVYTVIGGDEWGALVVIHFTILNNSISTTSPVAITSNQQPIEVISILGPFQPFYPGGPTVEITLKNVSKESYVSLTAVFTDLGPSDYEFNFAVDASNPLLPDQIISDKLSLIHGAFSNNISYPLTIRGILQNGATFSFTQLVQIVEVSASAITGSNGRINVRIFSQLAPSR